MNIISKSFDKIIIEYGLDLRDNTPKRWNFKLLKKNNSFFWCCVVQRNNVRYNISVSDFSLTTIKHKIDFLVLNNNLDIKLPNNDNNVNSDNEDIDFSLSSNKEELGKSNDMFNLPL